MGCTSRRTRPSSSTVTIFTITRRNIPTRTSGPSKYYACEAEKICIDRSSFNPDRYVGDTLTCAESSKLPDAMDRDHWAFGAGCVTFFLSCGPSIQSLFPCEPSSLVADFDYYYFLLPKGVASAQVSTLPNGSYGSRSHGCCGPLISDLCLMSPFLWKNTRASLGARQCPTVSCSCLAMIECKRCLKRSKKSPS
jgi:hypothetical protein